MGLEGLGLALGALGQGLGSIPEGSLKSTMEMPSYEEKVLANIKAQDALNEFRANAPTRAVTQEEALQAAKARLPFTSQVVGADVANKLLAPKATQAKIGLEEAQAGEAASKGRVAGIHVVPDKWGGAQVIGIDPANPRTFGIDTSFGALRKIPMEDLDKRAIESEMSLRRAHIDYMQHQKEVYGKLTPADQQKLDEDIKHHRALEEIAKQRANFEDRMSLKNDAQFEIQKAGMHRHFSEQVDKEMDALRQGPLGKEKFSGLDPEIQHKMYEYMRAKLLQNRILEYNNSLGAGSSMLLNNPDIEDDPALNALIKAGGVEPSKLGKWWSSQMPWNKEPAKQTPSLIYNPATGNYETRSSIGTTD